MTETARQLALLVPVGSIALMNILPGSAVVGSPHDPDHWLIDFEGNLNRAANLASYEDRLQSAAGRHVVNYPTTARLTAHGKDLRLVGHARHSEALGAWIVEDLGDPERLAAWLGTEALPRVSGSRALWDRAAGALISRGKAPKIATLAARRGIDIASAAFACVQEIEPSLSPP